MKLLYFKINLNKYGELRRQIEAEKRTFTATALSFIIITAILCGVVIFLNADLQAKINNRSALLSDIKKEIESYQVSGEYLSSKDLARMAKISTERIFWAKKLVALSEQTTDKIAITHFTFKGNTLRLFGITQMDKKQKEFDLIIEDFINKLKSNEQISSDFPEITFMKSRRDFEKDVEILRFQIDCEAIEFEKEGEGK